MFACHVKRNITGMARSDPGKGVISHASPLGSALLGKQAGGRFTARIADADKQCEVVRGNNSDEGI
ncbi:MAG: GreA/GreB family elongation factor [Patescibacteria group bacterium]